jgi:hypothetical protein
MSRAVKMWLLLSVLTNSDYTNSLSVFTLAYFPSNLQFCDNDFNITTTISDIIQRSVFYLKHDVSETALFPSLQAEPTELGPIDIGTLF